MCLLFVNLIRDSIGRKSTLFYERKLIELWSAIKMTKLISGIFIGTIAIEMHRNSIIVKTIYTVLKAIEINM